MILAPERGIRLYTQQPHALKYRRIDLFGRYLPNNGYLQYLIHNRERANAHTNVKNGRRQFDIKVEACSKKTFHVTDVRWDKTRTRYYLVGHFEDWPETFALLLTGIKEDFRRTIVKVYDLDYLEWYLS